MSLYKVLVDGRSCHGGDTAWPLPQGDTPGEWIVARRPDGTEAAAADLELCHVGLRLTEDPARWWMPGCVVYLADADGVVGGCAEENEHKVVALRARLRRPATGAELDALRIWSGGEHEIRVLPCVAMGSAAVWASGSAAVRASGSATVEAWGSATVEAWDSATVRAVGSATVEAWDSVTVEAWDSVTVRAWDSATVVSWRGSPAVRIDHRAVWIERGDGTAAPKIHVAEEVAP